MGDATMCAEMVWRGYHQYHCSRKALPGQRFCKQHSPEYKAEQNRKAQERYEAKQRERAANRERAAVALLRELGYTVIAPALTGGAEG